MLLKDQIKEEKTKRKRRRRKRRKRRRRKKKLFKPDARPFASFYKRDQKEKEKKKGIEEHHVGTPWNKDD